MRAIRPKATGDGDLGLARMNPVVTSEHDQARRQASDVPLERTRKGLVEVAQIERQVPLRRRPQTEVEHVRITAHLHHEFCVRSRGKVRRHDRSRPSKERPRRCHHAAEANRHEIGEPDVVLGFQGFHDAADTERRIDHAETAPRCTLSRLAANRTSTAGRESGRTRGGTGPRGLRRNRRVHDAHRVGQYKTTIEDRASAVTPASPGPR